MFIVFNQEYRKYESVIYKLKNKLRTSTKMNKLVSGSNIEIYDIDSVDILFKMDTSKMIINDKAGAEIISLDCHYENYGELQNAEWLLFCDFLKEVRNTYDTRIEKAKKEEAEQKVISVQAIKEKVLNNVLEK